MRLSRKILLVAGALALLAGAWLWWNRPAPVDMAAYAPADSIIYLEANSLPDILNGIVSTDAYSELAPAAGIKSDFGKISWLSRMAARTGIGSSDAVVLSRAQVAVAVLGFDAAEESSETLKITPRAALIVETHSSGWRARAAVEKLAGDFARRTYGSPAVERKEVSGTPFVIWHSPADARRKIVTAVLGSVAVIGNDETAVQACLAVRRGERPSLAGNDQLEAMRERLDAQNALAFGYAPTGSAAKVVEIFAPVFVSQFTDNPQVQSALAVQLPILTTRILGAAGWSSRFVDGSIEDRYFLAPTDKVARILNSSLIAADDTTSGANELLPAGTFQMSRYTFRDPAVAWQGFYASLSSQVDVAQAHIIERALEALLKPYGIEHPHEFLSAAGTEIVTAKIESTSENKLLIMAARDGEALRGQVRKSLGVKSHSRHVGNDEIFVSDDADSRAASFVGNFLIMGDEQDVRRCLEARAIGGILRDAENFRLAKSNFSSGPPLVTTMTADQESAAPLIKHLAKLSNSGGNNVNAQALEQALARRPYSVSETRLNNEGFIKITRSSFGLFGELIARFSPGE
ncbi:MAG: hypothetical protein LC754_02645 [Acidobacteria bacterium]|nr:hypothetical protein [Acidobacteriota bacterium]